MSGDTRTKDSGEQSSSRWGLSLPSSKRQPYLAVEKLSADDKRTLWNHLQNQQPDLARSLKALSRDPLLQEIRDSLGAELVLEGDEIPEAFRDKTEIE